MERLPAPLEKPADLMGAPLEPAEVLRPAVVGAGWREAAAMTPPLLAAGEVGWPDVAAMAPEVQQGRAVALRAQAQRDLAIPRVPTAVREVRAARLAAPGTRAPKTR